MSNQKEGRGGGVEADTDTDSKQIACLGLVFPTLLAIPGHRPVPRDAAEQFNGGKRTKHTPVAAPVGEISRLAARNGTAHGGSIVYGIWWRVGWVRGGEGGRYVPRLRGGPRDEARACETLKTVLGADEGSSLLLFPILGLANGRCKQCLPARNRLRSEALPLPLLAAGDTENEVSRSIEQASKKAETR